MFFRDKDTTRRNRSVEMTSKGRPRLRAAVESLESRRLLSVVTFEGASTSDHIEVEWADLTSQILIFENGSGVFYDPAGVTSIVVNGNLGDDVITVDSNGNIPPVTLNGGDGNDTIQGGLKNDSLSGGNGNDVISGGSGNDILDGGTGNDSLDGQSGNDLLIGGTGSDNLVGGSGTDSVDYRSYEIAPINVSVGNSMADDGAAAEFDNVNPDCEIIYAPDGNDGSGHGSILSASSLSTPVTLFGGSGNDTISGGSGSDSLSGSGGNDVLSGGTGNDTLDGGTGNDGLAGEGGNDSLIGGTGSDNLAGGTGTDSVDYHSYETTPVNVTVGNGGIDDGAPGEFDNVNADCEVIYAPDGNNGSGAGSVLNASVVNYSVTLVGGTGNDSLTGGSANDALLGQDGNDLLIGGLGSDDLNGGTGTDSIDYRYEAGPVNVTVGNGGVDDGAAGEFDNVHADCEIVYATNSNDGSGHGSVLSASTLSTPVIFVGGAGNDTLTGGSGADVLYGFGGNDVLSGNAGNDTLQGGTGSDDLNGGTGVDTADYTDKAGTPVNITLDNAVNDGTAGENDNVHTDIETLNATGCYNHSTNVGSVLDGKSTTAVSLIGSQGNDTLTAGSGGSCSLYCNGGTDTTYTLNGVVDAINKNGATLIVGSIDSGDVVNP